MPTYEGLRLKALKCNRKMFGDIHKKALKNKEFTIISNNCWGGEVYEYYNLQKQSPTVGLFFMAEDYIKFLSNLSEYLKAPLVFIKPCESKWKSCPEISGDKRFGNYPVGKLSVEDEAVEIFFLHYHSEDEAREKWVRRCSRIQSQKLLVKFNDQNGCTSEHIDKFLKLSFSHKLFFTVREWPNEKEYKKQLSGGYFKVKQLFNKEFIKASYEVFGKRITKIINEV